MPIWEGIPPASSVSRRSLQKAFTRVVMKCQTKSHNLTKFVNKPISVGIDPGTVLLESCLKREKWRQWLSIQSQVDAQ
jgi:hypothetical protein